MKNPQKFLAYLLVIGGIVGLLASSILTVEKIQLLKHPESRQICDINPVISCGSVINTLQASAFGFPNPIIGIAGFGIVTTVGMAILAGAKPKRWFWLGLQGGTIFGVGFVTWLQFQSIYRIGALCPYCMIIWTVTIPIFWYTTLHNLREGYIKTPSALKGLVNFLQRHHGDILIAWYLIIIGLILNHFWYYWSTLV